MIARKGNMRIVDRGSGRSLRNQIEQQQQTCEHQKNDNRTNPQLPTGAQEQEEFSEEVHCLAETALQACGGG